MTQPTRAVRRRAETAPARPCTNCAFEPAKARGLGSACLEYERRHGTPRPPRLILAHIDRTIWHPTT